MYFHHGKLVFQNVATREAQRPPRKTCSNQKLQKVKAKRASRGIDRVASGNAL